MSLGRAQGVPGVQEFRSSGVQEFRSSGVQEFRSSGVPEFRSSGVQEFRMGWSGRMQAKKVLRAKMPKSAASLLLAPELLELLELLNSYTT
jgi:hypothetical protein